MYIRKTCGRAEWGAVSAWVAAKSLLDVFFPDALESTRWKNWKAVLDLKLCRDCRGRHGKVYAMDEMIAEQPPIHDNCRCRICPMEAILAGGATKDGVNGADYWLATTGGLPDYYISKQEIKALGWKQGKPPVKYAPGKMYFGGVYSNKDGHLPYTPGRIWYEADINYYEGRRNQHRILFSNDGLLFVTYDHYVTFYEIVKGA